MSTQQRRRQRLAAETDVAVSPDPARKKAHDPDCGKISDGHQIISWHVAHHFKSYSPATCLEGSD